MVTRFDFPSDEWAQKFKDAINDSGPYRAAAVAWIHGAVALVVKADPALGLPEPVGIWLDLDRGVCKEVRVVSDEEAARAPFCISGEYGRWKLVMNRQLDPIKAMMQKKLELRGQMTIIVKFVNASKELVECSTRVPTRFLDETA